MLLLRVPDAPKSRRQRVRVTKDEAGAGPAAARHGGSVSRAHRGRTSAGWARCTAEFSVPACGDSAAAAAPIGKFPLIVAPGEVGGAPAPDAGRCPAGRPPGSVAWPRPNGDCCVLFSMTLAVSVVRAEAATRARLRSLTAARTSPTLEVFANNTPSTNWADFSDKRIYSGSYSLCILHLH